jgi:type II secretory pathway component PulK
LRRSGIARRGHGGSVLILVLWTLFVLSALAVALGARVSSLVRAAGVGQARLEARAQAFAAVALAQAQISGNTNAWDGPVADSWTTDPEVFGNVAAFGDEVDSIRVYHVVNEEDGASVTNIGVLGVESRINVNHAHQAVLEACFSRIGGLSGNAASAMAERVAAARKDEEPSKDAGRLQIAGKEEDEGGHGGAFRSIWELLELKDMEEKVWLRVAPHLTTRGSGAINLNAAPRAVLECLFSAAASGKQTDRAVGVLVDRVLELRGEGRLLEGRSVSGWLAILREGGELLPEASKLMNVAAKWADVGSSCWEGTAVGRGDTQHSVVIHIDFVIEGETASVVHWREW